MPAAFIVSSLRGNTDIFSLSLSLSLFLETALLGYNIYTVKFTHKFTIQLFLVNSQNCVALTIIQSWNSSVTPVTSPPAAHYLSLPFPHPSPWQPLIYVVSKDLSALGILYKWNHAPPDTLCLASPTSHKC